jgi:hypothetical protein
MIKKYSQLYLAKATKEQINSVAKKLNLSPEQIISYVQEVDSTGKYEVWLLKQMAFRNIILPEDKERIQKTLKNFEKLNQRKQLKFTNINQYKTAEELEKEIISILPKELEENYNFKVQEYLKLPGVSFYGQNSDYLILKVTDPESLTVLGDSTEWCTRHLNHAEYYIKQDGAQYVVFKKQGSNLIKFAQFAENFSQFKDVKDHEMKEVDDSLFDLATSKLEADISFVKRNKNKIYAWLEKNKVVSGDLNLSGTQITHLPEGLSVGGNLDLRGTQITHLPEGLSVGGYLDLSGTPITHLPEGLSVGGGLYLSGTQITHLPEGLSVGGNLNLFGTPITHLPEGLSVGGNLYLEGTQITHLPEGLSVGGYLDLEGTQITHLPEGLSVGGSLYGTNPKTGLTYQEEYNVRKKTSGLRKLKIK